MYVWHIERDNCSGFYDRLSFEFFRILQPNWEYIVWIICSFNVEILKCLKGFGISKFINMPLNKLICFKLYFELLSINSVTDTDPNLL